MARRQYDEKGLPISGNAKPSGNLTIRLDQPAWDVVANLRSLWSTERGVNLSITETIRAAIFHAKEAVMVSADTIANAAAHAVSDQCLACNMVDDGEAYKCLSCGRGLAECLTSQNLCIHGEAEATEGQKERARETASKPAPVKTARKRRK